MSYLRTVALLLTVSTCLPLGAQQVRTPEDAMESVRLGESNQLGTRLRNADTRASQKQWSEAIEEYQRLLVESGDELAPVDKRHVVQARWICQSRLAALPPEALKLYRSRIDPPAKKWLDQGRVSRDPAPLYRLVEEAFCSTYADQALDLLGDLAFERGDFDEAERLWKRIVRPATQANHPEGDLSFPDPKADLARVRAKQILLRLLRGDTLDLNVELEAFAQAHRQAQGALAGKKGNYIDLLKALAEERKTLVGPPGLEMWPQFARDADRNGSLPEVQGRLKRLPLTDGPSWRVRLDTGEPPSRSSESPTRVLSWTEAARSLGFYPVIAKDRVLYCDSQSVRAFELATGRQVFAYNVGENHADIQRSASRVPVEPDVAFPLTVVNNRIYARLGVNAVGPRIRDRRRGWAFGFRGDTGNEDLGPQSILVCLTMQVSLGVSQELWHKDPPSSDQGTTVFEGSPIVDHGRVYIALSRFLSGQTQNLVACYDAETGEQRWVKTVCETPELKDGEKRVRHHLLTLAGSNLVYCTHSGAIVALDAESGRRQWGVRYPSRGLKTSEAHPSPRSLAPCCYADGRIYSAPADHDRILCLDSHTGKMLWQSEPIEVVHLVGVAGGKLFLTMTTPHRGIRALDAATGSPRPPGWFQPGDGSDIPSFGRPLLVGSRIFWPTRDGLHVLEQSDGEPVAFDPGIRGNLAASDGCLIAADTTTLSAYLPERLSLNRRRQDAAHRGADARKFLALARAEADEGLLQQARGTLSAAEKLNRDPGLATEIRTTLHQVMLQSAQALTVSHKWADAGRVLRDAQAASYTADEQTRAVALEAQLAEHAGDFARSVEAWQKLLLRPALRDRMVKPTENSAAQAAHVLAMVEISRLIRRHGRSVYAGVEARAAKLARADQGRTVLADQLTRDYPHARVTASVLQEGAQRALSDGKPWLAAANYRSLLQQPDPPIDHFVLLAELAQAYAQDGCRSAALATLARLEKEGGERVEPTVHASQSLAVWAREQEKKLLASRNPPAGDGLYLQRAWKNTGRMARPVLFSESGERMFQVRGMQLESLRTQDGTRDWAQPLSFAPTWMGTESGILIVAGPWGMSSFRQGDGAPAWAYVLDGAWTRSGLSDFVIADGCLIHFAGRDNVQAWDVESGRHLWSRWAPGSRLGLMPPAGSFVPSILASAKGCLLETERGKLLCLDSRSGSLTQPDESESTQRRQPLRFLGNPPLCICSVHDGILAFEPATGRQVWKIAAPFPHASSGEPPQFLERDNTVLMQTACNFGFFLDRIDPRTGNKLWSESVFLGPRPLALATGDMDEQAFYCAGALGIEARGLNDGRLLWRSPPELSGPMGEARRLGPVLVSYPKSAPGQAWGFSWLGLNMQARKQQMRPPSTNPYVALHVLDPKTGQHLQSLNVKRDPEPAVRFELARETFHILPQVQQQPDSPQSSVISSAVGQSLVVAQSNGVWAFHAAPRSAAR